MAVAASCAIKLNASPHSAASAIAALVLRLRIPIVALIALLTIGAAMLAGSLEFNNSLEVWFLDDDPELVEYAEFQQHFGSDEFVLIGVTTDDVFDLSVLRAIADITDKAETVPYANAVHSITKLPAYDGLGPTDLAAFRSQVLSNELISGTLVSNDGTTAVVAIELSHDGNTVDGKRQMVSALRDVMGSIELTRSTTLQLTGTPVLDELLIRYNEEDNARFTPLIIIIIAIAGFVMFRTFAGVVLPLLVVMTAAIWTLGLLRLMGYQMTLVSSALIPLILAIGTADSIHILSEFYRHRASGDEHRAAVEKSLAEILGPCLITTATTAAGLLALSVSQMAPLREFALVAAAGVFCAFVISITLLPSLLILFGRWIKAPAKATGNFGPWLGNIAKTAGKRRHIILLIAAGVVGLSFWSMTRIHVGANPIAWLPESDQFRIDTTLLDKSLDGTTSLEFLIRTPEGGMADADTLAQIEDFEKWLLATTDVASTHSINNLLDAAKITVETAGSVEHEPAPHDNAIEEAYKILQQTDVLERWVNDNRSIGRLSARLSLTESAAFLERVPEIENYVETQVNSDRLELKITGYVKLMTKMQGHLVDSQIQSLLLAIVVISLLMLVLLRSIKLALFAMIPNLLPVIAGLGLMGALGIDLTPGTAIIGAIVLGLVVDDTVHFLVGLKRRLGGGVSLDEAIQSTASEVGRALTITSVLLAAGFGVLMFASYSPNIDFGKISAAVILFALVADLIVLPAALHLFEPEFNIAIR